MYPRAWATVAGALCLAILVFAASRSEADNHISSGCPNEAEITSVTPPDHAQRFHDGDVAVGLPIWISCEGGDIGMANGAIVNIPAGLNLTWRTGMGTTATWTGSAANGLSSGTPGFAGANMSFTLNKNFAGSVDSFQISTLGWNCGAPCQGNLGLSLNGGVSNSHVDTGTITIVDHPTGAMAAQTLFPSAVTQLANNITIQEANRANTPDPLVNRRGIWAGNNGNLGIRLEIPVGFGVTWDTTVLSAVQGITSNNGSVSTSVSYPNNRTVAFNVSADFSQSESVTIGGLKFNVPPATADAAAFQLNVLTGPAANTTPHATIGSIDIKGLPILNSAANQSFTVGDPPTGTGNIVLTDSQGTPKIKIGANSVRVTIPAALNMEWDPAAPVTIINTAGATTVLNAGLPYSVGNKTMNIDVGVANFGAGDSLTIQNARFRNFTARTPAPTALTLALTPALPAAVSDQKTRLIGRPQIQSLDDQVFVLNQGNATLHNITITDDATNPRIANGSKVRIRIPSTPGTLPGMQFTGVPAVGPAKLNGAAVAYPDVYTAEFTSSQNFAASETVVVSGLQVNVTNPNGIGSLQLLMSTNAAATPTFVDTRVLVIGTFPNLTSVAAQQFTVNDLPTVTTNPITVTAVAGSGGLFQSGKSLQLMIPDTLLCEWDTLAPGVAIGGSVAGTKVAGAVTYPLDINNKHKIVQLNITNDWVDTDTLTFTNLRFTNFSGRCFGVPTRLFLRVDVGGATAATDGFDKSIGLPTIVSTGASQVFGQLDGPTPINLITISEDANTPRILIGKHLRIRIPLGFPANWQRLPLPPLTLGGAGAAKVTFSQYYTNPLGNDVLEFLVSGSFATTDQLTISGPIFTGFASTTAVPFNLELEVNDSQNVPNAFDLTHNLKVGTRAVLLVNGASTADLTGNGSIDQVSLAFSKNLNGGTSVSTGAGFTIAGYTIISGSRDAVNLNVLHFLLAETGLPDTGAAPLVTYNALAAGADLSEATDSLTVNSFSSTAVDAASPVIVGFTFSDPDANGHLDTVTFTFSETLAGVKDITRWKLIDADGTTNLLASLTNADMIVGTTTITFNLSNTTGTSGTPRYQYIPGVLGDVAGNLIGVQTNNHVPVANGGIPLTVPPSLVTMDGSASFDPDGQPISFTWIQDVPNSVAVVALQNATTSKPSFLATQAGTYKFFMTVTDGLNPVTITVTVVVLNVPPTANAGPDQGMPLGAFAPLQGSLTSDPNGPSDALTYNWQLIAGPPGAAALNSNGVRVDYTATVVGTHEFELTVTDSALNVSKDRMFLRVAPASIPTAVAGPNIVAFSNTPVTLDGRSSISAGGPLTYLWVSTNLPSDPVGPLNPANTATTTFTPTGPGLFTFKLIVSNGLINSIPDPVAVLVMNPNNRAPEAVANKLSPVGPPFVGALVTLDGTSSSDPEGTPLRYAWTQVLGPAAVLSNPAAAQPTFTPVVPGAYEFQLVVSDTFQTSFPARVSFNVKPTSASVLPSVTVNAVPAVTTAGNLVTLTATITGATSWDQWTQTAGPAINLLGWNPTWGGQLTPTFTPTLPGIYRFDFSAWDANGNLIVTPVAVEVDPVPTANAGTDIGNATAGQTVTLDGTGSSLTATRFVWTQIAGPPVVLSDPYAVMPTFVPPAGGIYVFTLKVNDGTADSPTDVVIVTAAAAPAAPVSGGHGGGCGLGPELLLILPGMWLASLLSNRFAGSKRRS